MKRERRAVYACFDLGYLGDEPVEDEWLDTGWMHHAYEDAELPKSHRRVLRTAPEELQSDKDNEEDGEEVEQNEQSCDMVRAADPGSLDF